MEKHETISTSFLLISDTHGEPLAPSSSNERAYREDLPRVDVVLHCGDMSMLGSLEDFEATLGMLRKIDGELKLIIAGNHDVSLDDEYYQRMGHDATGITPQRAKRFWKLQAAKAGVTYLDEGLHTFQLSSGVRFNIYASPYQPSSDDWAFVYRRDQDRFNPKGFTAKGCESIALNPVPDFPDVDIMMTHGPPLGHLDTHLNGGFLGCRHLQRAAQRARPRLFCFGHIHEGYGAERVTWTGKQAEWDIDSSFTRGDPLESETRGNGRREVNRVSITGPAGQETLMVNAAIMDSKYEPVNAPWIVDIDLPKDS